MNSSKKNLSAASNNQLANFKKPLTKKEHLQLKEKQFYSGTNINQAIFCHLRDGLMVCRLIT